MSPSGTLYVRYGGTNNEYKPPYFLHNEQFSKLEELLILRGSVGRQNCGRYASASLTLRGRTLGVALWVGAR